MENSKKSPHNQNPFNEQFIARLKQSSEVVIQACESGFVKVNDGINYLKWIKIQFNRYASDDEINFVTGSLMVLEAREMLQSGNLLELQKLCIRIQFFESTHPEPFNTVMVVKIFLLTVELHFKNGELLQGLIILNEAKSIIRELDELNYRTNLQTIVNKFENN